MRLGRLPDSSSAEQVFLSLGLKKPVSCRSFGITTPETKGIWLLLVKESATFSRGRILKPFKLRKIIINSTSIPD